MRSSRAVHLRSLGLLLGLLGAWPGCRSNHNEGTSLPASTAASRDVPAPADLLAELVIATPARSWTTLRGSLDEKVIYLPRSVGGMLVGLFGLPVRAAQEFDESLPVVGALTDDGSAAIGIHVRSGASLELILASGDDATFDVVREAGVTRLRRRVAARTAQLAEGALAIAGNYFIFASDDDAAARLGPYLARTLGPRGGSSTERPRSAAMDLVVHGAGAGLQKAASRLAQRVLGAIPKEQRAWLSAFIDLDAAGRSLAAAMTPTSTLDVALVLGSESHRLDVTLGAANARVLSALETLDPHVVGDLEDDTVAALVVAESLADRKASATSRAKSLGDAVVDATKGTPFAREKLGDALAQIAEGRGAFATFGLHCTGAGPTAFARGPVDDRRKLERGVASLLSLQQEPAAKETLNLLGLKLLVERGHIEQVADEVTLVRVAPSEDGESERVTDARFTVGDARFVVAAGAETVDALKALHRKTPRAPVRELPAVKSALESLGDRAYAAFYVDAPALLACGPSGRPSNEKGALLGAVSPVEGGARLRIQVAPSALAAAAKGFR